MIHLIGVGTYYISNLNISIFILVILQALAFLGGIIVHMAFSTKRGKSMKNIEET